MESNPRAWPRSDASRGARGASIPVTSPPAAFLVAGLPAGSVLATGEVPGQGDQQVDAETGRAFAPVLTAGVPCTSGDVEVGPGLSFGELLEEGGGVSYASEPSFPDSDKLDAGWQ